jgi:hypothetical protein
MKKSKDEEKTQSPKPPLLLEEVLKKNGEEHLYIPIMDLATNADDDPPLIFGWENVEKFVQAMNALDPPSPPPPPTLVITPNMEVSDFKVALLNYAKIAGAAAPFGSTALPCTLVQCCRSIETLKTLEFHPWTQHIIAVNLVETILPIAKVCVPIPRSNMLDYAMVAFPNAMWR